MMNQKLQNLLDSIQQSSHLSDEEKNDLTKNVKDIDNEMEITSFKLDRTEKVKRTTSILLEETIEELKQKRKAVEAQNRELEIETALERVRTVAMSMNKPDDMLHVCRAISEQMELLKVKDIRNVQTAIFYEAKSTYVNYEFYTKHGKTITTEVDYKNHSVQNAFANQMIKGPNEVYTHSFEGEQVKEWYEFQKTTNVFIDTCLETANSLNYYWHSLGPVALGISTYSPLSEEENKLFRRFLKVFELSYRRYLDIEKALGQAKEARLETSLERVRAVAMAMKKSGEVINVCEVIYKELLDLGFINIRNAQIAIKNDAAQSYLISVYSGSETLVLQDVPYKSSPIVEELYNELGKSKDAFFQKEFSGKKFDDWREWREALSPLRDGREANATSLCFYLYSIREGHLGISTYNAITNEQVEILKRFKNVFELSYQRYTDVAKAEAQAREAKIEAALEKVRSRSLAVHKSDEFKEVIKVVFERLQELELPVGAASINIFIEGSKDTDVYACGQSENGLVILNFKIRYFDHPIANDLYNAHANGLDLFIGTYGSKEKNSYYEYQFEHSGLKALPADIKEQILQTEHCRLSMALAKNSMIIINDFDGKPLEEKEIDILKRFSKVFEQAYTRFLDLQKAEAQAREAQIENALEKVRSRTMAMQRSEELPQAANNLFLQVQALGIPAWSAGYCIWDEDKKAVTAFMSSEGILQKPFPFPAIGVGYNFYDPLQSGETFHVKELGGEEIVKHYEFMRTLPVFGEVIDGIMAAGFPLPTFQIFHIVYFSHGYVMFITYEPVPNEWDIFKRFGKVFEQTYTRFLDLQKAEAQARESQIQLALERARTQSMLMQHSKELDDTLRVFHEQVLLLGINSALSFLWLPDEDKNRHIFWAAWAENLTPGQLTKNNSTVFKSKAINYPLDRNEPATAQCLIDWESNEPVVSYHVPPAGVEDYFAAWQELIAGVEQLKPGHFPEGLYYVEAFMKYGCFGVMVKSNLSEEEKKILGRFAIEFERAYTRFLDLQKAETQAREAQIETALERVRSRTMGMQKSEELKEVIQVVYEQFVHLNINTEHTGFIMDYKARNDMNIWLADQHEIPSQVTIPYFDSAHWNSFNEAKEKGMDFFANILTFEEKNRFYQKLFELIPGLTEETKEYYFRCPGLAVSTVLLDNVGLYIENFLGIPYSDEENNTLMRFGKVFQQTYTRFLDLQKAEAQAREAKIEAALEKVRSRSLAMHKSDELNEVVNVVFEKLQELKMVFEGGTSIITFIEGSKDSIAWVVDLNLSTSCLNIPYPKSDIARHSMISDFWNAKENGIDFYAKAYSFEEKNIYFNYIFSANKQMPEEAKIWILETQSFAQSVALTKNAAITISSFTGKLLSVEENKILKRVANVFEQSYIRFLDLQKAEAQARESKIEAALERVRSRTLAMQVSGELAETSAVLFQQLILLGIEPNRLYVTVIKNESGDSEFWITGEDGTKVSSAFESNLNDNKSFKKMYKGWKQNKKSLMIDMKGKELEAYFQHLSIIHVPFKDGLMQKRRLQYIAYFNRGFIGMASPDEQPEETVLLLERFAAVFNLTFTRFNDLKVAEAHAIQAKEDLIKLQTEKKRAEDALSELQVTQKQLIQAEKMASLGELTAGIAHEIQNPLNFVNNFSEVSNELLDEMNEELNKGDIDEARAISNDIKQNLQKINHHGKRADAIVKGMLQHSQTSKGQKEPADINTLCDECLRLSYHGLRAKDKSFNAHFSTDFDPAMGRINIVPQDIGRVLLNLFNNAFYAVNEKARLFVADYRPIVKVSTKKSNDTIQIIAADNGNGIAQHIINKIFQPFFTTKPTGQGTGLGLSLAYDMVKAHGGEIKVETKDGEGTTFIIQLPIA